MTPPGRSTPKAQKISPSKGNSRSPHTPSPSKTGLTLGHGARAGATPPGRGAGQSARRELGLSSSSSKSSPSEPAASSPVPASEGGGLLWVDKYRPRSLKTVIGQQGDQSCANKLLRWLQNWHKHHASGSSKPAGRGAAALPGVSVCGGVLFSCLMSACFVQPRGLASLEEEAETTGPGLKPPCCLDLPGWGRPPRQLWCARSVRTHC